MAGFTLKKPTSRSYEDVLDRIPDLLKKEGFGVSAPLSKVVGTVPQAVVSFLSGCP